MKVTLNDIRERESRHVLQTYKRQPVAFVRGSGCTCTTSTAGITSTS